MDLVGSVCCRLGIEVQVSRRLLYSSKFTKPLRSTSESRPLVDPDDLNKVFALFRLCLLVFMSLLDCFAKFFWS